MNSSTMTKKRDNAARITADELFDKGKTFYQNGDFANASQCLSKTLEQNPSHNGALELMGKIFIKLNNYNAALNFYNALVEIAPKDPNYNMNLGQLYFTLGHYEKALPYLNTSLELQEHENTLHLLGSIYISKGEQEKGLEYLRKAYELSPDSIHALYNYAIRKGFEGEQDPLYVRLKHFLENVDNLSTEEKIIIYNLLFQAHNQFKDYELAFEYAIHSAQIKNNKLLGGRKPAPGIAKDVIKFFTQDLIAQAGEARFETEKPVFIMGMPRSGTTLLEQIICAHPNAQSIGEDNFLNHLIQTYSFLESDGLTYPLRKNTQTKEYLNAFKLAENYCNFIEKKTNNTQRVVDKTILNYFNAGYIHLAMPKARFIHISRDSMDSCISMYTQLFTNNDQPYSYDFEHLAKAYSDYRHLVDHWSKVIPTDNILHIQYEDLINDLEDQAKRVISFIGLPWNNACLEFYKNKNEIKTASVSQVRQPIYTSSVGRWKRYGPKIIPLINALAEYASAEAIEYANAHRGK